MSPSYYEHSGEFDLVDAVKSAAVSVVVLLVAALLYAWILKINHGGFLNFIALLILCFAVGATWGFSAKSNHIRNQKLIVRGSLILGAVALAVHWVLYVYLMSGNTLLEVVLTPAILLEGLSFFMQEYWLLDEFMITGPMVGLLWLTEAVLLIGVTYLCAETTAGQQDNIYCEECGRWTENESYSPLLQAAKLHSIVHGLKGSGELDQVLSMTQLTDPQAGREYLQLKLDSCPECDKLHVLDVTKKNYERQESDDDDDEDELKSTTLRLIENLLLGQGQVKKLREVIPFSGENQHL